MTFLNLDNNQISNLNPLADLTQLTVLFVDGSQISGISPISGLTQLETLTLVDNQISDISPLAGLSQLTILSLSTNQISDLNPLADLTELIGLYLTSNEISDIDPLAGLFQLSELFLNDNEIGDIDPLAGLSNLFYLDLEDNLLDVSENSEALEIIDNLIANFFTVVFFQTQKTAEPFLQASKGTFTDKIQITWQSVEGATYDLFRNTTPDSAGANLLQAGLSETVYNDITAQSGVTYYYWLEIKINGETISMSNTDNGYRAQAAVGIGAWGDDDKGQSTIPDELTEVIQVDAGSAHSIALQSDGTVDVFGDNSLDQLDIPVGLTGITAVAAGYFHNLALKEDGTVVAWGWNTNGQTNVPADLENVIQVSGGGDFSLALKADGTVVAWGNNFARQRDVPKGLTDVIQVAAGGSHALALKEDGTVVAWGNDADGQATVPMGLSDVEAVAAGKAHSLALKADSTIVAWGSNNRGQLELPGDFNSPSKQGISAQFNASSVFSIAAGFNHNLALDSEGNVIAWGDDTFSQATVPDSLSGVVNIAAGGRHNIALFESVAALNLILDGSGVIAGEDIQHSNGNIFDQVLLAGESIQLQAKPGQITRVSFMDEDEDIVQLEFSGSGNFTVTLDPTTYLPPALPPRYNQQVEYVTGKPRVVIEGADATTFFSIFTVGRINAVNQALFPDDQDYDAQADVTLVEVINSTGIGGMQLSNTVFSGSTGKIGVDARGVPISVRLTVGDIDASGNAAPYLLFGQGSFTVSAGNSGLRITGGDLVQSNGASIVVAASGSTTPGFETLITQNNFKSDNTAQPTQSIDATFANVDGDDIIVTVEEVTIE